MPKALAPRAPTEEYTELAEWSMYVAQRIFFRRRRGIREPTLLFEHAKRTCGILVGLDYKGEPRDPLSCAWNTLLARYIAQIAWLAMERGLYENHIILITGPGGSAKTTYAYWAIVAALSRLGLRERYPWPSWFILDAETLRGKLKERSYYPALLLDDVGSFIPKYWVWLRGERKWVYLFSIIDQAKDFTGAIVMTARSTRSVAARLREIAEYVVEARKMVVGRHVFIVFKWKEASTDEVIGVDVLPPTMKLPQDVWEWMSERRYELRLKRLEEMERMEGRRDER